MLNASLTVRAGQPNSHADRGWNKLTDAVIKYFDENSTGRVFMLWGSFAKKKGNFINPVCFSLYANSCFSNSFFV